MFCGNTVAAQIRIGLFGNLTKNFTNYNKGYFEKYSNVSKPEYFFKTLSGGGYLSFRYDLNRYIAIRSDLEFQSIACCDSYPYFINDHVVKYQHPTYHTNKVILPIMGCIYYDLKKYQVYLCLGMFGSYCNAHKQSLKDFDLGFTDCIGASYQISKTLSINFESKYYRGFLDQHNTGSEFFKQPIYNQLLGLSVGLTYLIDY